MAPKKTAAQFLADTKGKKYPGGTQCRTCAHSNRKAIEKACDEFIAAKAAGHLMPFRTFVSEYITTEFNYPFDFRALQTHLENCIGKKVRK